MKDKGGILDLVKVSGAVDGRIGHPVTDHLEQGSGGDPFRPWLPALFWRRHRDDDDDDPPPCPAVITPFPRLPPFGAEAELEAA